jgi:aminopeptidase N
MKSACLAVFVASVITPHALPSQDPAPESFRSLSEQLQVKIDFDEQRLAGSITFNLQNWTNSSASSVSILLHRLMEAKAVRDGSGRPLSFTQDVVRFKDQPMRQVTQLLVTLREPVPAKALTTIRIDYSGYLTPSSEIGWLYVRDQIDTAFTILRRDGLAFPEIASVTNAANRRMPRSEFTYTADVQVPAGFVVAAGGTSSRVANSDGTVTWRYESGKPAPFLNISIARFKMLDSGGVRIFYFSPDSSGARYLSVQAQNALHLLSGWFGPLHDEPRLTIAEIPDGWGSQAHLVAGIIQTASAFRDTMQVGQLYHELTHLWNAPDIDPAPPRWNEGLASFLQGLMQEKLNHWPGRRAREEQRIANLKRDIAADSMLRTVPLAEYGAHDMTGRSYTVGNIMFSAYRDLVGEAAFNKTVGGFYQQFNRGGTTADFVALAKTNAPREISKFFDDWIYSTRWTQIIASSSNVNEIAAHYR